MLPHLVRLIERYMFKESTVRFVIGNLFPQILALNPEEDRSANSGGKEKTEKKTHVLHLVRTKILCI